VKFLRNFILVFVFLLVASLCWNALSYGNFDQNFGFLRLKQQAIETGLYLPAYYSHVLIGGLILVIGFFQLLPMSLKFRQLHRMLGAGYVFGILFFSAPGGLVMAFFIDRGPLTLLSFVAQCTLWFWCTAMAYRAVRNKNIAEHQAWMWRSYALTFAAVTLRLYIFMVSSSFDLSQPSAYALLAWLSWVPNLLLVEIWIRRFRRPLWG